MLHIDNITDDSKVVTNLSKRVLTATEISALNNGLQFGILPSKFDFLQAQASFERLYQESRPYLNCCDRIELKQIIMNMYSKYKLGYFFTKQQDKIHGTGNLATKQREALFNLRKDSSLMIGKPDKDNGVVVKDRAICDKNESYIKQPIEIQSCSQG